MTAKKTQARRDGEGSIRLRADGKWEARLRLDNGKRVSAYRKTEDGAEQALEDMRAREKDGKPVLDSGAKLKTWIALWIEATLPASGRAVSTQDLYRCMLTRHVVPKKLGGVALRDVRASALEVLLHDVSEKISPTTGRQVYAALSACFATAVRDKLIAANPLEGVKRPSVPTKKPRALSADQVRSIIEKSKDHRHGALVVLLATTGLRRGEALALLWTDLDLEAGELSVNANLTRTSAGLIRGAPKTAAGIRTVPLPKVTLAALREHRKNQNTERLKIGSVWSNSGLVFTQADGKATEPRNVSRWYSTVAKACGVEDEGMHALRHYAATAMIASGTASIRDVADILGHASPTITLEIYTASLASAQRKAIDALGDALG